MRTIETTVYSFSELSDRAKETARDRWREGLELDADFIFEDAAIIAGCLGWDIRQTRCTRINGTSYYEPTIYYAGFWSQGDGACFVGDWRADSVNVDALKAHAPQDAELHRIAARIAAVAQAAPDARGSVKHRGHYYHSGCTTFDFHGLAPEYDDDEGRTPDEWAIVGATAREREEELVDATREFMDWIYARLRDEWGYQNSDEAIDDSIEANGLEFTQDGGIV